MLKRLLTCMVLAAACTACGANGAMEAGNPFATENLFVAHRTVVGVNAAVNSDQTSGHLLVGYDRRFLAVAPSVVEDSSRPGERDAMAVVSCSDVEVSGITLSKFVEQLATGRAARKLAETAVGGGASGAVDVIFDCWESDSNERRN